LTEEEKQESEFVSQSGGLPKDPAKKREWKIRQYRREKDLRDQILVSSPPLIKVDES
jgi:hypothetical protein